MSATPCLRCTSPARDAAAPLPAQNASPLIGILGGTGPAATVRLLQMIVDRTDAQRDQDHVLTLALNDASVPDRTAFLLGRSSASPIEALIRDAQLLEAAGCTALALPCNTAHCFLSEIGDSVTIPIIDMVEETVSSARLRGLKRLSILATEGTVAADLYGGACRTQGVDPVYPAPDVQRRVNDLIYRIVKSGRQPSPELLDALMAFAKARGCDGIVLGCTELSIAFATLRGAPGMPVLLDSLAVLADCVIRAGGKRIRRQLLAQ